MRLAICWEDDVSRGAWMEALGDEMVRQDVTFSLEGFRRFRDVLYELEDGCPIDILLLGVVDAATTKQQISMLRAAGYSAKIILLGTDPVCAVEGYDWGIDGFWLMPTDPVQAVERLKALSVALRRECLLIRCHRALYYVHYAHIVCVESRNNKCVVHRDQGESLTVYMRLDDVEAQLQDVRFLRCHQSFLINMDHVCAMDKHFELNGGITASICQRRLKTIREKYVSYMERVCTPLK